MRNILLILVFTLISKCIIGQAINNDYALKKEAKYANFMDYTDQSFPTISETEKSITEIGRYKRDLEEYAKLHPPVPKFPNTGNPAEDIAQYKILCDNWYANNPNFPRFIQYHLFHKNLTIEDDNIYYEKAIKVWYDHNPQVASERNK